MPAGSRRLASAVLLVAIAACGSGSTLPERAGFGPRPVLPEPRQSWLPTMEIAPAAGWSEGRTPVAAEGLAVRAFATGLDHPRWLHVLPNGDVLVAETNAPERPDDAKGLRGWVMRLVMKRAGSGVPSANRLTLLRDADGDGVAEMRSPFAEGLVSPFGMALAGDALFVADTDALLRFDYREGETSVPGPGKRIAVLPAGPLNHHWTKNVIASRDGSKLYVAVGSNSNAAENGLAVEKDRARILEIDAKTGHTRPFATGLRNPVGLAWNPESGALWTAVNERDELGDDLVPDYMTAVREAGFYGWPFCYYGSHLDPRVEPDPKRVETAIVPDYALGAHTASLGLAFYDAELFPRHFRGGAFVGQHGSWNRKPRSGYKVVFVPFQGGRPAGPAEDVLTGFVDEDGRASGRPVGVAVDRRGGLLVADDVGNAVWRVVPAAHD